MIAWLKKIKYYILIFLIIEIGTIAFLNNSYIEKEKNYYLKKTNDLQITYSVIVNSYSLLTQIIFDEIINKPEVIDIFSKAYLSDSTEQAEIRETLYQLLLPVYQNLKQKNLVTLHFQLLDCTSFLRFHRPEKFGDDLSASRYSIKLANTEKINVQGFEIGSSYHGYRYIFPLFHENLHIGSLEIGISFNAFKEQMEKIFPEQFSFIIKKNIVEKNLFKDELNDYITSNLSDQYLIEKISLQSGNSDRNGNIEINKMGEINLAIRDEITQSLQNDNPFAVSVEVANENFIVTLIPIHNPENVLIAYIISYARDNTIKGYRKNFYNTLSAISIISLVVISFIYYVNYSNKIIKQSRDFLQSVTDNMIAGLLVIDANHKVISANPAAEKMLGLYMHEIKGRNCGNILYYKDNKGNNLPLDKWPIFDNLNFGLTYKGEEGFFIGDEYKEIPIELTATPHYKDINIVGYIIVFRPISY